MRLTLVCPVNDKKVAEENFLRSKVVRDKQCPVIVIEGAVNVPKALNFGKMQAVTTHMAFIHQDVFLPDEWLENAIEAVTYLTINVDSNFGALGPAGRKGKHYFGNITDRGKSWGSPTGLPTEVDTLDELCLITRKDNVWFDEDIPTAHLYGADLCLSYKIRDLKSYAINLPCVHNSTVKNKVPDDFNCAKNYIRKKYYDIPSLFPIYTTCTIINRDSL